MIAENYGLNSRAMPGRATKAVARNHNEVITIAVIGIESNAVEYGGNNQGYLRLCVAELGISGVDGPKKDLTANADVTDRDTRSAKLRDAFAITCEIARQHMRTVKFLRNEHLLTTEYTGRCTLQLHAHYWENNLAIRCTELC